MSRWPERAEKLGILQLATLKTLAQAYLVATPSPEHWEKAEETIKQALVRG